MAADPIHQFRIIDLFPVAKVGHTEIAFTNSAAFMLVAVVGITAFLVIGIAKRSVVPSRLQSAAELAYEFVALVCEVHNSERFYLGPEPRAWC
jgi:F-type H+-transporting ATPase subunit a